MRNYIPISDFQSFCKIFRKNYGMTQKDLARLLDVDSMSISRWERGLQSPRPIYQKLIACMINNDFSDFRLPK